MSWIGRAFAALKRLYGVGGDEDPGLVASGAPRSVLLNGGSIRQFAFHRVMPTTTGDTTQVVPAADDAEESGQTIVITRLRLVRDDRPVLRDIDLMLYERRIAILGLNGSGKSSLLKLMVGLLTPSSGTITLDDLDPGRDTTAVRARTGFLFQSADNQIVYPIVREDLAFGLGGPGEDVDALVSGALDRLGIGALADRRIHELSGGERQLVALAGVLARDPLTILFDEPTSQLDLANRNRFRDVLAALPQQAIVVTHDLDLVADFDRVLVIEDGRLVCDGQPAEAVSFYRRRHG